MSAETLTFTIDGVEIEATPGQTIIQACDAAGIYIPRLCHHPELEPAGHCRICTCKVNGHLMNTCMVPAAKGMVVENNTPDLNRDRRTLVEMLFVEGNHFCPACEKSGNCELQALGYRLEMTTPQLPYLWEQRTLDATHPDIFIDRNRCILCSRCIRASRIQDGKSIFGFHGRGINMVLNIDSKGRLDDTALAAADKAAHVCPVGCIVLKGTAYHTPHGQRAFDERPIGSEIEATRDTSEKG